MRYFLVTAAMQLSCAASPFLKANALRIRPVDLAIRRGDRHVSFAITQKLKRLVEGSFGRVAREARNPERGA